jgi:hypothetical protein
MATLSTDRFEADVLRPTEVIQVIQENIGEGRLLCLDTVFHFLHMQSQPELQPNRLLIHDIPDVRGYDPIISLAHTRWMNAVAGLDLDLPARGRLFVPAISTWSLAKMLGITAVVSRGPVDDPQLALIWTGGNGLHVYAVRNPGDANRWVPQARATGEESAHDLVWVGGFRPDEFDSDVQVLIPSPVLHPDGDPRAAETATVTLLEKGFDHAVYRVEAETPGFLLTDIAHHPGWQARIDGERDLVYQGNTHWVTVGVPAGTHRVELKFRPWSLVRGALLTLAGLTVLVLVCLPRREPRPPGPPP